MQRNSLQLLRVYFPHLYRRKIVSCSNVIRPTVIRSEKIGYVAHCKHLSLHNRKFSTPPTNQFQPSLDRVTYEAVCKETLESLTEYFDEIIEEATHLKSSDVSYSDGVLTVQFGNPYGTYVINRQTPNRQIWLSSPTSGPKRFDFVDNCWIYRHTGESLHELLDAEISKIVKIKLEFQERCAHGKK